MIRVLIADDSPTARTLLSMLIEDDPDLELAGVAENGEEAVKLALKLEPDVVTMDLVMPGLSGFDAIRALKAAGGPPVIVVSSALDPRDEGSVFAALELGAVSAQAKPRGLPETDRAAAALLEEIKAVAMRPQERAPQAPLGVARTIGSEGRIVRVAGIAASTGGPQAVQTVLSSLGRHVGVPVLVVQHIAPGFLTGMAAWLAVTTSLAVVIAEDGMRAERGKVYLAPDGAHMTLSPGSVLHLDTKGLPEAHRPSADPLFESLASVAGRSAVGVVLTGMGSDGTRGLGALHRRGGWIIAEDQNSSVVWGMPGSAVKAGAVDEVLPLKRIGPRLAQLINQTQSRSQWEGE
ncbi:MAG: chemotaxis-specific protein-glutamate methyltransferase CheB [Nitrospiraceae bacterium]|nr:chemotaxis-specific protein-glutamate methyltransferase CheB [Nitrospiraceae bacterium]